MSGMAKGGRSDQTKRRVVFDIFRLSNRWKSVLFRGFSCEVNARDDHLLSKVMNTRIEYSLAGTAWISAEQSFDALDELLALPMGTDSLHPRGYTCCLHKLGVGVDNNEIVLRHLHSGRRGL